jgi:L-iditol 2-dehydrogenase
LFVAALARMGQRPVLADPNPSRLKAGLAIGAARTLTIARGGGQAERVRRESAGGKGFWIAVDCTGQPGVWSDAIESGRPGGLVNLFGGCAPGASIPLDTTLVHYSELTLKGVYHHRPQTFARALAMLADPDFHAEVLLSDTRPITGIVDALQSMMRKEALKVVIRNP